MSREQMALNFFQKTLGLTREQAAGIVASGVQESGLNEGRRGDGGKAFGVFQWHQARADDILRRFGIDVRTAPFTEQLRAAALEMQQGGDPGARNALAMLRSAQDFAQSSSIFSDQFERPANRFGTEESNRAAIAADILSRNPSYATQNNDNSAIHNNATVNVTVHGNADKQGIKDGISDHAFKMPAQLELSYGWSNASMQALADVADDFADSSSLQNLGEGYVRKVYDALLALQKRRELCTIVTMKHLYKNMIITSVATETTPESAYSMFVTATCQEVLMARSVTANASASSNLSDASTQATPANTQSVLYMGTKQLTPVNDPSLSETYSKWAGMIGLK
ncbi:hypothetical protein AA101099_1863 [Neoasaia chiangmaiensis NBRC 101099]|nr:phage tail tip lysozyme [Neoasaia chiangmaiensis]GBR39889.1 hypothetical protein AA101099_1863 [Neoasaia chiangmaiensis NBRC 101099]GEN14787.1 hypothetical protein NCH01_12180 [Neoasaia chiangmaiensis]